jgi:hypothetical protein
MSTEIEINEEKLDKLFGYQKFFSPVQLVRMGLYTSRSSVWEAINRGDLETIQVSQRRFVIIKESIIKHIMTRRFVPE